MAKKAKTDENREEPAPDREFHGRKMPVSKSDAIRMAIAAGFDTPQVGSGYIQSQFGLDVSPEHFSSVKSADKKKELSDTPRGKPGRKPKGHSDFDLVAAIETMKPLVAAIGADKVKQIADLLS